MAPCDANPKCKNASCPKNRKPIKIHEDPDNVNKQSPSWSFNRADKDSSWAFTQDKLGDEFWSKIYPKLISFEQQNWGDIVAPQKTSHFVDVNKCNKCARDRLDELRITEQELLSLRLEGTIRIYGIRPKSTMFILWYDNDHGDNDTCVYKSNKSYT